MQTGCFGCAMTTYKITKIEWLKRLRRDRLYDEVPSAYADHCLMHVTMRPAHSPSKVQRIQCYILTIRSRALYEVSIHRSDAHLFIVRTRVHNENLVQSILTTL